MNVKAKLLILTGLCLSLVVGCSSVTDNDQIPKETNEIHEQIENSNNDKEVDTMKQIQIKVENKSFICSLQDTATTSEFMKNLPMSVTMEDLHRNEKFYYTSSPLPSSPQSVSQLHTGELKLFGSDCLVLFYKDFKSSYTYTSIGQIDNPNGLAEVLGNGDVTITFENIK